MIGRKNTNFQQVNKHEKKFTSWVNRECELKNDIYITDYSNIQKSEDIILYMKLKFSNLEGIFTSDIKSVEKLGIMIIVTTRNTIYKLKVL